jgi:hypothetical protein
VRLRLRPYARRVQILLNVDQSSDKRLTGTVTLLEADDEFPFSGTLELLARVEELLSQTHPDQRSDTDHV